MYHGLIEGINAFQEITFPARRRMKPQFYNTIMKKAQRPSNTWCKQVSKHHQTNAYVDKHCKQSFIYGRKYKKTSNLAGLLSKS
jgi:hypothetical protein